VSATPNFAPGAPAPAMTDARVREVAAGVLEDAARLVTAATEMTRDKPLGHLVQDAEDHLRFIARELRQWPRNGGDRG
jgi:hypothetical protein